MNHFNPINPIHPIQPKKISYTYVGCFNDTTPSSIPNILNNGNPTTADVCCNLANKEKYGIFGLDNNNKCYASNDINLAIKGGIASTCGINGTIKVYVSDQSTDLSELIKTLNSANLTLQTSNKLLESELGTANANFTEMNANWQTNYNAEQKKLIDALNQVNELQFDSRQSLTDKANMQASLFNTLNTIALGTDNIANQFTNSQTPSPLEAFDTVGNYSNNIQSMNKIINTERQHLEEKKESIDNITFTQNRAIKFMTNATKRLQLYQRIIITWVIAFTLIFIVSFLNNFFPIVIPIFIIMLIATIVSIKIYMDIRSRSNMDFDIYNLSPPTLNTLPVQSSNVNTTNTTNTTTNENSGNCIGQECCSTGTVWNSSLGKCVL